ncbi:MAG: amidohydrolase [Bacteroidota bacterium]|nr:amidohydrolase [Bacteroidota bacterium]
MDLQLSVIQSDIVWENIDENLDRFSEKIEAVPNESQLIILPELFATGFSMQPGKFAARAARQINRMKEFAKRKQAVIVGSIIAENKNQFFNRLIWMNPNETFQHYDKRHLFSFAGEDKHYTAGESKLITAINEWNIRPLICYDLRFPVWSRNTGDYHLLIYIANWPERRSSAWKTLLKARAIENQSYVVGVNRVGKDGNGILHSGNSVIIDPKGNTTAACKTGSEEIISASIKYKELNTFRKKFPALNDADNFYLKP